MKKQDEEIAQFQAEWLERNKYKPRWIITEEDDGTYSLDIHNFDNVHPTSKYADRRKVMARLSQMLGIGPVAPQTWPERLCIGSIEKPTQELDTDNGK